MSNNKKMNLLINLQSGFFKSEQLKEEFERLEKLANIKKTSYNTNQEIVEELAWSDAVIMWASPIFTEQHLEKAGNLKFLGQINTTKKCAEAALKKGILLSEARHCWSPTVAELALGLILSGLRRISAYHIQMRAGTEKWIADFPLDINPQERQLTGRKVGIVGFGRVGQRLSELLAPFQVDLSVYDPYLPTAIAETYNARMVTLQELLKNSEIVVLCAANNAGTNKLLGQEEINLIQKDSLLVNVGRSSLLDMNALEKRLERGDIVAMLDVFDSEPLEKDSLLRRLPNVYLTPHRAGAIIESVKRALVMLTDDFEAFLEGKELKYPVTEAMINSFPES